MQYTPERVVSTKIRGKKLNISYTRIVLKLNIPCSGRPRRSLRFRPGQVRAGTSREWRPLPWLLTSSRTELEFVSIVTHAFDRSINFNIREINE